MHDSSVEAAGDRPVVVGVDGSGTDTSALDWAAVSAVAHNAPLVVVHASAESTLDDATPGDQAAQRVRSLHPGLQVEVRGSTGPASGALMSHQGYARMLVVGSGQKGTLGQLLLGTTSLTTVLHAACPVAVVNGGVEIPPTARGVVMVAIDGSENSACAAHIACSEAAARSARVVAVGVWNMEMVHGYVVTEPDSPEWRDVEAREQHRVEATVAAARERHPEVPFEITVLHGPVSRTLVEHAATSDLLVMGHRGRGGFAGKVLGSVTQKVLRSATCPVLVVKEPVRQET